MWKITTRGFTLHEVLIMAATNVASALIATYKSKRTTATAPSTEIQQTLGEMSWQR
jgi:Tfp pilus assembly protein PilV